MDVWTIRFSCAVNTLLLKMHHLVSHFWNRFNSLLLPLIMLQSVKEKFDECVAATEALYCSSHFASNSVLNSDCCYTTGDSIL